MEKLAKKGKKVQLVDGSPMKTIGKQDDGNNNNATVNDNEEQ